jgi:integrase
MAKIYENKLKDGTTVYRANIYMGISPKTGKKQYSTISDKSYRDLQNTIDKLAVERRANMGISTNSHGTYLQIYNDWLKTYKAQVKPSTFQVVQTKFKKNVLPYLGYYRIDKITTKICQNYITKIANEPNDENSHYSHGKDSKYRLNRRTVREMRMYATLVFKYAIKHNYIAKNPMEFVEVPRRDVDYMYSESDRTEQRKYWLKEEVQEFLELAQQEMNFQDFVMFRLVLFSGMRKGELQALHWGDINFKTGELWIGKTLVYLLDEDDDQKKAATKEPTKSKKGNGHFELQKPKTVNSKRTIVLDRKTLNYLQHWRSKEKEWLVQFSKASDWHGDPPCFISGAGNYNPLSHMNNVMDTFYEHHPDFYRITVHQMRHTHASLLFESGATIKDVQMKLGHENIQTTMNIYTHITKTKRDKTQANFAKFMDF